MCALSLTFLKIVTLNMLQSWDARVLECVLEMMYLSTAIELSPGGRSTVHIYT